MDLLVVGAGAMGRWFAGTIAEAGVEVAFADTDPDVAVAAAERVGGRAVCLDTDDRFDGVCLAVPMSALGAAIGAFAPRADRAVVDVTGSMREPIDAMRTHAAERERVSFHPLFAPENAPGRIATVADATGPVTDEIRRALGVENTLFETTTAEHDDAMVTVQARAHAAILAYALAAEDVPDEFETPISAALSDLTEQLLSGSPRVYAEIRGTFDGVGEVATAAERIADADRRKFEALYREARESMGR